ncbi:MAG: DUF1844 domain-containing protein [Planctomycetaceae bacterium]|jgi:predicted hydrolase (HD superfamily)|nr:DUF1844 domain-containing protein [Planctomycetaceae bacterium]
MTTEKDIPQDVPLPEPSLLVLVSGIAAQAMTSMGIFPNPINNKTEIKLNQAKHLINTIAVIESKTEGNRTDEESTKIAGVLHELRTMYLAAQREQESRQSITE